MRYRGSGSSGNGGFTLVELVAVVVLFVVLIMIMIPALSPEPRHRRASCANNLKQIGLSMKMYANESWGELFPRMGYYYSPEVDCAAVDQFGEGTYPVANGGTKVPLLTLMFNLDDMHPEYLPDLSVLVCPQDSDFSADDLENPVTGEIDMYRHCLKSDRGLNLADASYTYLSHLIDKCGGTDCAVPYTDFSPVLQAYFADDVAGGDVAAGASVPVVCAQFGAWFDWVVNAIETDPQAALTVLNGDFDMTSDAPFDVLTACQGLQFAGNGDGNVVYRLREELGTSFFWDGDDQTSAPVIQSGMPVMFDRATVTPDNFNHHYKKLVGSNVLYMDGHVEYWNYPGDPPVSENVLWVTQCIRSGSE